jgi:DNA polymerase-4
MAPRAIIHMDLDAFFVAVERLDQPALAGLPVIVGGRPEGRGVVASASYEARRFGVHSAMPTATALRLCPQAVLVHGHRARYAEMSQRVMALLGASAPLLEQFSIDEASLDVTGTEADWAGASGPHGGPGQLARALQDRVQAELGLSASFGVASNKLVAKIASDLHKPHGITVVPPGTEAAFLAPLPLARLWGAGPVTRRALQRLGVETIGDVAALSLPDLRARFGSHGEGLWRAAHGIDDEPVVPEREVKSVSREETFARDIRDGAQLRRELLRMSDEVAAQLRQHSLQARTVAIKLRYADFSTYARQATLDEPTDSGPAIYARAEALFAAVWNRLLAVRLLGVAAAGLAPPARQLRLFEEPDPRQEQLDAALDRIRARFGKDAVRRASLLDLPDELWVKRDRPAPRKH